MIAADLTLYSNPVNRALGESIQVCSEAGVGIWAPCTA